MTHVLQFIATPDGPFGLIANDEGAVVASGWTESEPALRARLGSHGQELALRAGRADQAADAVEAFYAGDIANLQTVAVRQTGTALQQRGWQALRGITPGQPLSYGEFAAVLERPTAHRAAASICARNAVALFVPCHRVLRADGSVGGFAWGTQVKLSLLARERDLR